MKKRTPRHLILLILSFAAIYLIWGSTYLAIRVGVASLPPLLMAGGRFLLAGGLLLLWARLRGDRFPSLRQWGASLVIGALLFTTGNGLVTWAEKTVESGTAALLIATVPIFMVLLGALWFERGPVGWPVALGLLLGFLGVWVLVDPAAGVTDPFGASLLIGASFSWAMGSHLARRLSLPRAPVLAVGAQMITGGLLLLLCASLRGEWAEFDPAGVTPAAILAVLYLAIPGAIVAYSAYVWLLRHASMAAVSTYAFVNPLVAVLLGWAFLNEAVSERLLVALGLIIGAVVLLHLSRFRRPQRPAVGRQLIDVDPVQVRT